MIDRETTTRFGLIRHASSQWNEQKRIQGQKDSPLSPGGRKQARTWGKELSCYPWQRILCSDLERARETAALINTTLRLPLTVEPELREQDWGRWSGLTLVRLREIDPDLLQQQVREGWNFAPPEGESRLEVMKRAMTALRQAGNRYPEEYILVVCHEGVIKCVLYRLLHRRFLPEEPQVILDYHLHLLELRQQNLYLTGLNRLALRGRVKISLNDSGE